MEKIGEEEMRIDFGGRGNRGKMIDSFSDDCFNSQRGRRGEGERIMIIGRRGRGGL